MLIRPCCICDDMSYFLNNSIARKLTLVLLFTLVVANVAPTLYIPSSEASTGHHSKAKNDGTGLGEGAPGYINHKHVTKSVHPKSSSANIQNGCNCVIFRLDDVQDYWLNGIQTTVMDQFIQKNQPLSLGVIMAYTGNDAIIVNKVNQGASLGLFELSVHGWDHVDYSQLNLTEQTSTLQQANGAMKTLFGNYSNVFITPYDTFNDNTLVAMNSLGYKIISAAEWADNYPRYIADGRSNIVDNYGIYHLPESIGFVQYDNNTSTRVPNGQILATVDSEIASQGYAVITLHAQDFRQKINGAPIDVLNQTEIQDLNSLMKSINSKNYHIRTFNQVIQFKQGIGTTTTLASNDGDSGHKETVTAKVLSVAPHEGIPTGTVTFGIDGISQAPVKLESGKAVLDTSTLPIGQHSISAQYSGDAKFIASTGTTLIVTVKQTRE